MKKNCIAPAFVRFLLAAALVPLFACASVKGQSDGPKAAWERVPSIDWSKVKPEDFADDELDLPYYLANFGRVADSVVETGENRGFIDLAVWRNQENNKPYNARIMENILSLAYFYSTKRPWNQYYGLPEVRDRLEAALDFWCRLQSPDGRFSEYGPKQWNLAATAFATKFMGQTLTLLKTAPPINTKLMTRVAAADRKAINVVLTDPEMYEHGRNFTNQYTNAWAGALAFLSLYPDFELQSLVRRDVQRNTSVFQSSAGYFYEAGGPDWGYNLGTHHSNLALAWHYAHGTNLGNILAAEEKSYVVWLSYNAVREPDGSGFTLNRAIETRQRRPFLDSEVIKRSQEDQGQRLLASQVELARAFLPTREEIKRVRAQRRAELAQNWTHPKDLGVGTFSAFSPYAFLHRSVENWYPTTAQRDAAIKTLPYLRSQTFVHQRVDNRSKLIFTYIRRPHYYAAFNSGPHLTSQQRYGLGLIWNPEAGSLLQSQTGSMDAAWGTILGDRPAVYEAETLNADFNVVGKAVAIEPGNRDLPAGVMSVKYSFSDQGGKVLTFNENRIDIEVHHSGALRENIPLLLGRDDNLEAKPGEVSLARAGKVFVIKFGPTVTAETLETKLIVGQRRVVTVVLRSRNDLVYTLDFSGM